MCPGSSTPSRRRIPNINLSRCLYSDGVCQKAEHLVLSFMLWASQWMSEKLTLWGSSFYFSSREDVPLPAGHICQSTEWPSWALPFSFSVMTLTEPFTAACTSKVFELQSFFSFSLCVWGAGTVLYLVSFVCITNQMDFTRGVHLRDQLFARFASSARS